MAINIRKVGELYQADVTPLDSDIAWSATEALSRDELIAELRRIGCHTTDTRSTPPTQVGWIPIDAAALIDQTRSEHRAGRSA
jgi:hypothetical protein